MMLTELFQPANRPFTVALLVMLGIGLVEVVGLLLGGGLSGAVDHSIDLHLHGAHLDGAHLDASDLDSPDLDADAGAIEAGLFTRFLGWMQVGRVPFLVLLVLFLLVFGLAGLFVQGAARSLAGHALPAWIAAPVVAVAVLPAVRVAGKLLARIIPRDETEAVSLGSFVGRIATVTLGTAVRGQPAEAKLRDRHGHTHYVLVEPDLEGDAFPAGTAVLLVSRAGAVFRAIKNPNPSLLG